LLLVIGSVLVALKYSSVNATVGLLQQTSKAANSNFDVRVHGSSDDAVGNVSAFSQKVSVTMLAPMPLATPGPLRVLASNPRYFTDGSGKAIYLAGSHTWSNLIDRGTIATPPPFDYPGYTNFMASRLFNFMRLWTVDETNVGSGDPNIAIIAGPLPWARTGPGNANDGKPKFDLNQFEQSYFDRLRAHVVQAGQNGIYVSVMLFAGYDLYLGSNATDGNPFKLENNINNVNCPRSCPTSAGLARLQIILQRVVDGVGSVMGRQVTGTLQLSPTVWGLEQAYIRKVVDTVNDLDNVLYEVANEASPASISWQYNVINYVKQYEATKPKQHPVGMTALYGGNDDALYGSPADWISPGAKLPLGDGRKVVINDTDHSYFWMALKRDGQAAQRAWAWKNFMLGNSAAFMDPYLVVWPDRNGPDGITTDPGVGTTPDSYWDVVRNAMRDTRKYAERINLAAMTPQPSRCSTGYCLVNPGNEYLVYQPGSGAFTVNLVAGAYNYEWFNPALGSVAQIGATTTPSGNQTFVAPFGGDAVLYLKVGVERCSSRRSAGGSEHDTDRVTRPWQEYLAETSTGRAEEARRRLPRERSH